MGDYRKGGVSTIPHVMQVTATRAVMPVNTLQVHSAISPQTKQEVAALDQEHRGSV